MRRQTLAVDRQSQQHGPEDSDIRQHIAGRRGLFSILLDTARIQGASRVDIDYQPTQGVVRLCDDGVMTTPLTLLADLDGSILRKGDGIEGWHPDRLRFAALLATSSKLKLLSSDQGLTVESVGFLSGQAAAAVRRVRHRRGCVAVFELNASLQCESATLLSELAELVVGFGLPVSFNGQDLPRPLALREEIFSPFLYGHYRLFEHWAEEGFASRLFVHGLPVAQDHQQAIPVGFAIHLESDDFCVRYPGSDRLRGDDVALAFVAHDLEVIWRDRLKERLQQLGAARFARRYTEDCLRYGMTELLNDCPLHPNLWGLYTRLPYPGLEPTRLLETDPAALLEPTPRIVIEPHWLEGGVMSLQATYLYLLRWPVLTAVLGDRHWAQRQALDATALSLSVNPGEICGVFNLQGRLHGIRLVLCQDYYLNCRDDRYPSFRVARVPTFCARHSALYLPHEGVGHIEALLLHLHPYRRPSGQRDFASLQADSLDLKLLASSTFGIPAPMTPTLGIAERVALRRPAAPVRMLTSQEAT